MVMLSKKVVSWLIVISFLVVGTAFAASKKATQTAKTLDRIVAVVNDDVIMESELQQKTAIAKQQLQHSNMAVPGDAALRSQVLNSIIDMNLQLQVAKKANLEVSAQELNKVLANIAAQNKMTLANFQEELARENINYNDFREQIHNQMLVNRVQQEVLGKKINVSEEEIAAYIKKHNIKSATPGKAQKIAWEALYRPKFEEGVKKWIKELRGTSYIKIMR